MSGNYRTSTFYGSAVLEHVSGAQISGTNSFGNLTNDEGLEVKIYGEWKRFSIHGVGSPCLGHGMGNGYTDCFIKIESPEDSYDVMIKGVFEVRVAEQKQ